MTEIFTNRLKCSCVKASATEKPREVHCWNGYWIQGSERGDMTAELFIADGRKIYGGGSDEVGDFTWTGKICFHTHSPAPN